MQMQNQQTVIKKIKRSHLLLIGSLLVFVGVFSLSANYLLKMKSEVFSDMNIEISMSSVEEEFTADDVVIKDVPIVDSLTVQQAPSSAPDSNVETPINYDKYLGVLEIPKIGLKRGFYNIDSKYNNIQYNVTMVNGSTLPDVVNGNLILMAHSGDAYISFFAYLYRLNIGDYAYVTYGGNKYKYQIVNIYEVEKNGVVRITRNYERTCLTMITCTKDNDNTQTVYIAELV